MTGIAALEAQEGERLSCRGERLLTVRYAPPGETKAVLVWHHGYGEHVGRYKWGALRQEGYQAVPDCNQPARKALSSLLAMTKRTSSRQRSSDAVLSGF